MLLIHKLALQTLEIVLCKTVTDVVFCLFPAAQNISLKAWLL